MKALERWREKVERAVAQRRAKSTRPSYERGTSGLVKALEHSRHEGITADEVALKLERSIEQPRGGQHQKQGLRLALRWLREEIEKGDE